MGNPGTWYGFKIPNLPKPTYEYVKVVRERTGLSPWQVIVLALKALEHLGKSDGDAALRLVEDVRREYPKP